MSRVLATIICFSFASVFFSHPDLVQAGLFSKDFTENVDTRPPCDPIREFAPGVAYNPKAFSQISVANIDQDCSNMGWSHEDRFASDKHIEKTAVLCGAVVDVNYSVSGSISDKSRIELNQKASEGTLNSFNNLSLEDSKRDQYRTESGDSKLIYNELGSIYTHTQVTQNVPEDKSENSGLNPRLSSFDGYLKERLNYCEWLAACQANPDADKNERVYKAEPLPRCVNPMNYDVYPEDPAREVIVNEADVCAEASGVLASYLTCPSKYFTPCTPDKSPGPGTICQRQCNPDFDQAFADKFLAFSPTNKARENIVICQVKAPDTETKENATKYEEHGVFVTEKDFDCIEVLVPAGSAAYAEGILENTHMLTSANYHEQIDAEFKEAPATKIGLKDAGDDPKGPLIYWKTTWFAELSCKLGGLFVTDCRRIERLKQYARRINYVAQEAGDIAAFCPRDIDSETFGDPNQAFSSGTTGIKNQVKWERPEDGQASYQALLTFTLEPKGLWAASSLLAHIQRQGGQSRLFTPGSKLQQLGDVNNAAKSSPIPLDQGGDESVTKCEYPNLPSEDTADLAGGQRCRTNSLALEASDSVNPATTYAGGSNSRYPYLGIDDGLVNSLTKGRKPFMARDNSKQYKCDWYRYTHGLPPLPECLNAIQGFDVPGLGTPSLPNKGTCEPGSGTYCNPEFLSQAWGEYARDASMICTRESGNTPQVVNMSCLDGGTYDFSIGLFQMNGVPIPRFDDNGTLTELVDGKCPNAFVTDINQVGITQNYAYPNVCIIDTSQGTLPLEECTQYMSGGTNISTNFSCTPAIKSCLAKFSGLTPDEAAANNSALAAQMFKDWGYRWCGPWKTKADVCGLCN